MVPQFVAKNVSENSEPIDRRFGESFFDAFEQKEKCRRWMDCLFQISHQIFDRLVVNLVRKAETWKKIQIKSGFDIKKQNN